MKVVSTLSFQEEAFTPQFVSEAIPLAINHWIEVGRKDLVYQPDWETYFRINQVGMSRLYTARRDGVLRGYAMFLIRQHWQYKDVVLAIQEAVFLAKDERKWLVGVNFLKFCDEQLKNSNVNMIQHTVTFENDWGNVLNRLAYTPTATIYERRI